MAIKVYYSPERSVGVEHPSKSWIAAAVLFLGHPIQIPSNTTKTLFSNGVEACKITTFQNPESEIPDTVGQITIETGNKCEPLRGQFVGPQSPVFDSATLNHGIFMVDLVVVYESTSGTAS